MSISTSYQLRNAVAASFPSIEAAHEAAQELKKADFEDVWIGIVKRVADDDEQADPVLSNRKDVFVEAENWFQRLFGEGEKTLHDVLVDRGVNAEGIAAAQVLKSQSVILTVDSEHDLDGAARVIRANGGRLLSSGYEDTTDPRAFSAQPYAADLAASQLVLPAPPLANTVRGEILPKTQQVTR